MSRSHQSLWHDTLKSVDGDTGNKHALYRALRAFFNWLYSPGSGVNLKLQDNPVLCVNAPQVPKLILPSLSKEHSYIALSPEQ